MPSVSPSNNKKSTSRSTRKATIVRRGNTTIGSMTTETTGRIIEIIGRSDRRRTGTTGRRRRKTKNRKGQTSVICAEDINTIIHCIGLFFNEILSDRSTCECLTATSSFNLQQYHQNDPNLQCWRGHCQFKTHVRTLGITTALVIQK